MCPGRMQSRLTAANLEPSCGLREARGLVERSQSLAWQCWSQTPPRRPSHISEVTNSDCWQVLFSLGQQNRVPGHSVFMLLKPTSAARACLVDHELAASDVGPVEGLDCVVCGRIGHFDESKASGPSGLAISDHTRRIDRAMRLEHLAEIVVGCCVRQVAYEQIHSVFLYSGRDADPCGYPRDPKSRFERIVQPETSVSSEVGQHREILWFRCVSSARARMGVYGVGSSTAFASSESAAISFAISKPGPKVSAQTTVV